MDPGVFALIVFLLIESFGPGFIAIYSNNRRKYLIAILSLLVSWTQIGAIAMFIWALKDTKLMLTLEKKRKLIDEWSKLKESDSSKIINCETCKKEIAIDARLCPHCGTTTKFSKQSSVVELIIYFILLIGSIYFTYYMFNS